MKHFSIRGICRGCRKMKWFVRKRNITLPIGQVAESKDLFCTTCYNKLQGVLNQHEEKFYD